MIYENPPGAVYVGDASYAEQGFGWAHSDGYWATTPPYPLNGAAETPYGEAFPLLNMESVVWSGTQKNDQVMDGYGHYWDAEHEEWVFIGDGKGFVLRPYFFRYLYDSTDFMASISTSVSTGSSRAHWKNMLDNTVNNMHLCPLFWTPRGLALPSWEDADNWAFPSYQSAGSGVSMLDCTVWLSKAPYPVAGLCVLGRMDSTTSGGLINDRTEITSSAWIGQTDGYFSCLVNGRPAGYINIVPWDIVFRDAIIGLLPWSGSTIKEVCSVDVGSIGRGGIFK